MADAPKTVVSNVLCFLTNKVHSIADKNLKSLLIDFYSGEEVSIAKDLLLSQIDLINIHNLPKIPRQRRISVGRSGHDLDDMFISLGFLDENKLIDRLPPFVATSPDKMPSARLLEGDVVVLWEKLSSIQNAVAALQLVQDSTTSMAKETSELIKAVVIDIREIGSAQNNIKKSVQRVELAVQASLLISESCPPGLRSSNAGEVTDGVTGGGSETTTSTSNGEHSSTSIKSRWVARSEALVPTDSENEVRDRNDDFSLAPSKNAKKNNKRKERDAALSSPTQVHPHSKKANVSSRSYAAAAASLQIVNSDTLCAPAGLKRAAPSLKTVGNSNKHRLEAAHQELVVKAVFCIGNVATTYTVKDIKDHCQSLGIRALFCYDISFDDDGPKYFKLAVRAVDSGVVMDPDSWPSKVFVREWHVVPRPSSAATAGVDHPVDLDWYVN